MNDADPDSQPGSRVGPWSGFLSGIIWWAAGCAVIFASHVLAGLILGFAEIRRRGAPLDEASARRVLMDGDLVSIAFPIAAVVLISMLAMVIKSRRRRPVLEYLGFEPLPFRDLLRWLVVGAILFVAAFVSSLIFSRPEVPEWVGVVFPSVDGELAFFFAIVVCAPVLEEVLYRGYVLRAWVESRLHAGVAIVLLSLLWAVTHVQYDLYDKTWIFFLGLLLAYARLRSRSLYPAIAIHCAWNLAVFIEIELYFSG